MSDWVIFRPLAICNLKSFIKKVHFSKFKIPQVGEIVSFQNGTKSSKFRTTLLTKNPKSRFWGKSQKSTF